MRTDIPRETRRDVLLRAGGLCECCGERKRLTLHHLHYDTVGAESPNDMRALCWDCHKAAHRDPNGDYRRDPQEMGWHWQSFHDAMAKDD